MNSDEGCKCMLPRLIAYLFLSVWFLPGKAAEAAPYPDPILNASETGPIICSSSAALNEFQQKLLKSIDLKTDPALISIEGCFHLKGKFQVKVIKDDDGIVEIKIPGSDLGDKSAFVFFGSLISPDADQRPAHRYQTAKLTVACRRTTDFDAAATAIREMDLQWFKGNENCHLVQKGTMVNLIAVSLPMSKVCVGSEGSCWPAWMLNDAFNEIKAPPRVFSKGKLKVCWPKDTPVEDREQDYKMPVGVIFRDFGVADDPVSSKTINITVVTTQAALLRKTESCVLVAGNLVDDPEAKWDNPAVRILRPDQNRLLGPVGIVSKDGSAEMPLPDSMLTIQPDGFVYTPFGEIHSP